MAQPFSEGLKDRWKETILDQRQSKLSIASWCRQNAIAVHTFYYWQSKLFPKLALSRSAFSEAIEKNNNFTSGMILEYNGFKIHLDEHFSPSLLKKCVEVIRQC
jgi:hypothetical protein